MAGENQEHTIGPSELSAILGIPSRDIPVNLAKRLSETDTRYSKVPQRARDAHILQVLQRLEEQRMQRSTEENISAFEQGWKENLDLCKSKGLTRENLRPKYVRPYSLIRFQQEYIAPQNPFLAYDLLGLVTSFGFQRYFAEYDSICEFGCGTGQYLFELAQLFPDKMLIGTDWTNASVGILELMAQHGLKISGRRFDMLKPDPSFQIPKHGAVLSVGALEQLGPNFEAFLTYLLSQQPGIVVHYEPIEDFYELSGLVDWLGYQYHRRRGYLQGYLPALRALEAEERIEILEARRMPFGDPFHESGSLVAWRPRQR